MAEFKDFSFEKNEYESTREFTGTDALVLAVRNILLSRPGNFPFNPSLGMNIEKYSFEFLDKETINTIKTELERQLSAYFPNLNTVEVNIEKVEDENGKNYLGIRVSSIGDASDSTANFLLKEKEGILSIINEIR